MYGDHLPTMGLEVKDVENRYLFQTQYVIWDNIGLERRVENLSAYQMNFLKAVIDGIHSKFSSKEIILKYNLGTSANIVRLKSALLQKELIETDGKEIILADPVFGVWFKKEVSC